MWLHKHFSLLVLLLSEAVSSQTCNTTEKWAWGRYFLYDTSGETIADLVNADDVWSDAASGIIEFAAEVSQKRFNNRRYLRCLTHDRLAMEYEFPTAVAKMNIWGFQELEECVVDVEWDRKELVDERKAATKVFKHLSKFDEKLTGKKTVNIVQQYDGVETETSWSKMDSISRFKYDGPFGLRECEVFKLVLLRDAGEWSLDAGFTNFDKEVELQDLERWYGSFLISFNGSIVTGVKERSLFGCDINGNDIAIEKGTFNVEVWAGKPGTHAFITERTQDNRGIIGALEKSALRTELVAESRLASSIAILFLPSTLALFPVSLFQEVSFSTSFVYSLATDILSIVPVVIKGIELIYFGLSKQWAIYSRFYGGANPDSSAFVIHWISYCSMKRLVLIQGVLYVILGLGLMIIGISLELIASKKLESLKNNWYKENSEDPAAKIVDNAGLLWHWKYNSDKKNIRRPN